MLYRCLPLLLTLGCAHVGAWVQLPEWPNAACWTHVSGSVSVADYNRALKIILEENERTIRDPAMHGAAMTAEKTCSGLAWWRVQFDEVATDTQPSTKTIRIKPRTPWTFDELPHEVCHAAQFIWLPKQRPGHEGWDPTYYQANRDAVFKIRGTPQPPRSPTAPDPAL